MKSFMAKKEQVEQKWLVADPASGRIEPAKIDEAGRVAVSLPPRGAVVLIGPLTKPKTTGPR